MAGQDAHNLSLVLDPAELAPEFGAIKTYWDKKRGARAMPRRADIDPVELRTHLPYFGLVDVIDGGRDFRFRLLGTEFSRLFGRDSTGKTLTEVYGAGCADVLRWMTTSYAEVLRTKRPVLRLGSMRAVRKDFIRCDSLLLPLADDGEHVNMIMGRTVFQIET
jgi:hypothetical protein